MQKKITGNDYILKKIQTLYRDYLRDRLSGAHLIADLTKLMKTKAGIIYKTLPDY